MRTVTYQSLLAGALKMAGEDPAQAQTVDQLRLAEFLDQGLSACHEFWRWPELVEVELRYYRAVYDPATAYAAGDEVYFPAALGYYRALRATTGNAPAALDSSAYVANNAYWAELGEAPAGDDWATATDYAVGDIVRRLSDGGYYMAHTAHTSGAFDPTKFGLLAAFRPFIAYEQLDQTAIEAVIECHDRDPRADPGALKVPYRLDAEGVRFAPDQEGPVWVEFRRRCPAYAWSVAWTATSFAADAIVYHAATGGVYQAASAAIASDVPGVAALWELQEVPYIFRHAAKAKALAAWHESEGQTDKALVHEARFAELLEEQVWQYTKLQGQTGRTTRQP